jgi:hypothetical protein
MAYVVRNEIEVLNVRHAELKKRICLRTGVSCASALLSPTCPCAEAALTGFFNPKCIETKVLEGKPSSVLSNSGRGRKKLCRSFPSTCQARNFFLG